MMGRTDQLQVWDLNKATEKVLESEQLLQPGCEDRMDGIIPAS